MASMNHTTREGDRWDTLAYRYYGGNHGIKILTDANPNVPITAVLSMGLSLVVPIVDDSEFESTNNLPPWKQ